MSSCQRSSPNKIRRFTLDTSGHGEPDFRRFPTATKSCGGRVCPGHSPRYGKSRPPATQLQKRFEKCGTLGRMAVAALFSQGNDTRTLRGVRVSSLEVSRSTVVKKIKLPKGREIENRRIPATGWVAEWFKAAVLKTAVLVRVPGVRIPPHPLARIIHDRLIRWDLVGGLLVESSCG